MASPSVLLGWITHLIPSLAPPLSLACIASMAAWSSLTTASLATTIAKSTIHPATPGPALAASLSGTTSRSPTGLGRDRASSLADASSSPPAIWRLGDPTTGRCNSSPLTTADHRRLASGSVLGSLTIGVQPGHRLRMGHGRLAPLHPAR